MSKAFAVSQDIECPNCKVRLEIVRFELGHEAYCTKCLYRVCTGYGYRLKTMADLKETTNESFRKNGK